MTAVLGAFLILGALAAAVAASRVMRDRPIVGLYIIAVFVIVAWEIPTTPSLSIGGLQVKPEDALTLIFLVSLLLNGRRLFAPPRNRHTLYASLVVLVVLVALSVLRGLFAFDVSTALNEARGTFWLLVASAWVLAQDWRHRAGQMGTFALIIGSALTMAFGYHAAVYGWGGVDSFVGPVDFAQTGRPLVAGQAIFLTLCAFYLIGPGWKIPRLRDQIFGLLFLIIAVASQHRSVWVAIAAGGIVYLFRLRGRALERTVFIGFYSFVVLAIIAATGALKDVFTSLGYAVSSDRTLTDRANTWSVLIDEAFAKHNPMVILFGEPFGSGYFRKTLSGATAEYTPHNWYVVLFLRIGVVGLVITASILLAALFRLLRNPKTGNYAAILAAILAFGYFYHLPWYLSVWLGLAVFFSLVGTSPPRVDRDLLLSDAGRRAPHPYRPRASI